MKNICVYASSSQDLAGKYFDLAGRLSLLLAREGYNLVFGGGTIGLMGACARAFHEEEKRVISVIPEYLKLPGVYYEESDEVYVTESLRKRKRIMEDLSQAFVILPGGFGTLEELLEIITLKQLGQHKKPIVILNSYGFYDKLKEVFHFLIEEKFARDDHLQLFYFAKDEHDLLEYLRNYKEKEIDTKWVKED